MSLPQKNGRYTYADYCQWDDGGRWELIDGIPYAMSPAPSRFHQKISGIIFRRIGDFLEGKPYEIYHAPFDVRLNADDADDTVVQPDLVVVCDPSKLSDSGCHGAPDLIVEILSPASVRRDSWTKYMLYKNAGVREYWIVDPDAATVNVHLLRDGEYVGKTYGDSDIVPVSVLRGCAVRLEDVFGCPAADGGQ